MEKTVKNTEGVHSRSASPPRTLTLFEAKSQLASPPYNKCQKITKILAVGYKLLPTQGGVHFVLPLYIKKEAYAAFL